MRNKLIRCIIFFTILAFILIGLSGIFTKKSIATGTMNSYYEEPKGAVDVVFFGASSVHRSWCPPIAWKEYGITSYNLSSGRQPLAVTRYVIEEALKIQSPALIVVDLKGAAYPPDNTDDLAVRLMLDSMRLSMTRINGVTAAMEFSENPQVKEKDPVSFYINFLLYHSRWDGDLKSSDFSKQYNKFKGFYNTEASAYKIRDGVKIDYVPGMAPLKQKNTQALNDLLDYCDTLKTRVLFTINIAGRTEDYYLNMNYIQHIAEQRGYTVLNFSTPELLAAVGYDLQRDFQDKGHLNISGALRHTRYLAQYINDNYGIPDKRGNPGYESWDESYRLLAKDMHKKWNDKWTTIDKPM